MTKNGWIKLYRKLRDNPLWKQKPYSKGQAWVDLLLRANHKDHEIVIGNKKIEIKRGEVFTSELKLAQDWGWSRHKVANFLNALAGRNQMQTPRKCDASSQIGTPKRTSKYTLLSIINWELYQSESIRKDIKKDIKRTSKGHQKDTNKNVKNDKNDKKIYSLFDFWNSLGIIVHKNIKGKVGSRTFKGCLEQTLNDNTEETIKEAMQNYKTILEGEEYFWKYRWTLGEFLIRGLDRFLTINKPFENFAIKERKDGASRQHYRTDRSRKEDKYKDLYEV